MKILATACRIDEELKRLIRQCKSCEIAVAWATVAFDAYRLLQKHSSKIAKMVVGTHFYQTHPDFIEAFMTHPNVRFVLKTDGVFHPKVYLFELAGERWECVIGSPNFTAGGLGTNEELAVLITNEDDGAADALQCVKSSLSRFLAFAGALDRAQWLAYKEAWKRKQPVLKNLKGKFGDPRDVGTEDGGKPPLDVLILRESWDDYFSKVQSESEHHNLDGRLSVIREVKRLFSGDHSFHEIDLVGRKKIAGLLDESLDGVNYMWFGSMTGAGKFWRTINLNDMHLSDALELISLTGLITRDIYLAYIEEYRKAFPQGRHGIGTATRLLSMKRPDIFVCLDARNEAGLCKAFGVRGTVDYDKYWDSIIQRVMDSVWWNAAAPAGGVEREVWDARTAFLDSLFYDGKGLVKT